MKPSQKIAFIRDLRLGIALVFGVFCLGPCFARAQDSIDWSKIAGGGGTSANGQFTLNGTIGQPDAGGPMTNGQYSLSGGFWALPQVVQTVGSPILSITRSAPGSAVISWSPSAPGFVLQETVSLSSTNWSNSPSGSTNPVIVPAALPAKFYRLFKP